MPKTLLSTKARTGDHAPCLTIQDVATMCNVAPVTVRRWIREGRLPAVKLGPQIVRIKPCDVKLLETPVETVGAYL